jgi:uncharacterized membrane protein
MFAADYRRIAREKLQNKWPIAIGIGMLASILGGLLIGNDFFAQLEFNYKNEDAKDAGEYLITLFAYHGLTIGITSMLNLVHFILGGVIQLGYAKFLLKQHDQQEPQANDLFSYFDHFGTGFCQLLLRNIYTALWSLLFVIPGIVASYRYAMTPYILAENPELTASEAINISKEMMYDHKWELFCLDLSFFGWHLLCGLTGNLGYIALNPYTNAARTVFYRQLQANR